MATESKNSLLGKFKRKVRSAKQKMALKKAQRASARNRRMGTSGGSKRGFGGSRKMGALNVGTGPSKRGAAVKTKVKAPVSRSRGGLKGKIVKAKASRRGGAGKTNKVDLKTKLLGKARIAKGNARVAAKKAGKSLKAKTQRTGDKVIAKTSRIKNKLAGVKMLAKTKGGRNRLKQVAKSKVSSAKSTAKSKLLSAKRNSRFSNTAKLRRKTTKANARKVGGAKAMQKTVKRAGISAKDLGAASKFRAKRKSYDPRKKR